MKLKLRTECILMNGNDPMLGALIGKGNTADVFEMGTDKVLKLFKAGYPLKSVLHEFENSKLLNCLALPIVKSHELRTYEGRHGIVYERLDGKSMLNLILEAEDQATALMLVEKYAADLALLHQKLLACQLPSAVSLKLILKRNIEGTDLLSMQCKAKVVAMLEALPDGDGFCHGDFHFGNVMVSQEQYSIIDYMNVCRGHLYGDIARTVYLIEMTPVPSEISAVEHFRQMKKRATDIYLKELGVDRKELSDWLKVIAAARLAELDSGETNEQAAILNYLSLSGA